MWPSAGSSPSVCRHCGHPFLQHAGGRCSVVIPHAFAPRMYRDDEMPSGLRLRHDPCQCQGFAPSRYVFTGGKLYREPVMGGQVWQVQLKVFFLNAPLCARILHLAAETYSWIPIGAIFGFLPLPPETGWRAAFYFEELAGDRRLVARLEQPGDDTAATVFVPETVV
jgi:hypothetical protein